MSTYATRRQIVPRAVRNVGAMRTPTRVWHVRAQCRCVMCPAAVCDDIEKNDMNMKKSKNSKN